MEKMRNPNDIHPLSSSSSSSSSTSLSARPSSWYSRQSWFVVVHELKLCEVMNFFSLLFSLLFSCLFLILSSPALNSARVSAIFLNFLSAKSKENLPSATCPPSVKK